MRFMRLASLSAFAQVPYAIFERQELMRERGRMGHDTAAIARNSRWLTAWFLACDLPSLT